MKRLMLLVIAILSVSGMRAQNLPLDTLIVYRNMDGGVWVFIEQTAGRLELLDAAQAPASAYVAASLLNAGRYAAVQVMEVNNHTAYPAHYNGKTIGELGLQNTLYVFSTASWDLLFKRPLLPDSFIMDFFVSGGDHGFIYDVVLEANLSVQAPAPGLFIWVEGVSGTGDDSNVNGYGRLVIYDDMAGTFSLLDPLPGTPYDIMWSGRFGIFRAITSFGTGAGYSSAGTYLLDIYELSLLQLTPCCRDITPYGWFDDGRFIYSYYWPIAGAAGLFAYDPASDTTITILPEEQQNIDYLGTDIQSESRQILITTVSVGTHDDDHLLPPGTYLYTHPDAQPKLIYNLVTGQPADRARFISPDTVFVANVSPRYVGNYHIVTGELLPDELAAGYVYPSPYGVTFSPVEGGALMYQPILEGGAQHFIPSLVPEYIRWFDGEFFFSFIPYQHRNLDGSSWAIFGRINGEYKIVDLGEGAYVLDAMYDPFMR